MINASKSPIHNAALEALAAESKAEVDAQLWAHWNRIVQNEGRDSNGDLVQFTPWAREHFDPPGYLVQHLRWQGGLEGGDTLGGLTDPPLWGWAGKGDDCYPPEKCITIGLLGTDQLFVERIAADQPTARKAAWADYDRVMKPVWDRKVYGAR